MNASSSGGDQPPPTATTSEASESSGGRRTPKAARDRFIIILGTWFVFTVFFGLASLFGHYIYQLPNSKVTSVFDIAVDVFRGGDWFLNLFGSGDLFVISTVIAADAFGRLIRCFYLNFKKLGEPPAHVWLSLASLIVCLACLFFNPQYFVSLIRFVADPGTEMPTELIRASRPWFLCTVVGSAAAVVSVEALPARAANQTNL